MANTNLSNNQWVDNVRRFIYFYTLITLPTWISPGDSWLLGRVTYVPTSEWMWVKGLATLANELLQMPLISYTINTWCSVYITHLPQWPYYGVWVCSSGQSYLLDPSPSHVNWSSWSDKFSDSMYTLYLLATSSRYSTTSNNWRNDVHVMSLLHNNWISHM